MKKVLTILGARPQFIKAAAVSRIIQNYKPFKEVIIHTGQHFDFNMSDIFFDDMDIPRPHYNLEINSLLHGAMTGRMLEKIEEILQIEHPDMVMVYGDTNSTLAGALAARKLNIRVSHVEAGLRSFNLSMPEEINRILTDRISDLLFCPTDVAVENLENEGFKNLSSHIFQVGDVMYDAALYYGKQSPNKSNIINNLGLKNKSFVLCTVHRQENTDDPEKLSSIMAALNEVHQDSEVILPLHPRTRKRIQSNQIDLAFDPVEPIGYFDIIELLKNCNLVITDSGGMQKEAYFFNKYCITMREQTEWIELVDNGYNILAGYHKSKIIKEFQKHADSVIKKPKTLFGTGNASEKIIDRILKYL